VVLLGLLADGYHGLSFVIYEDIWPVGLVRGEIVVVCGMCEFEIRGGA